LQTYHIRQSQKLDHIDATLTPFDRGDATISAGAMVQ
jgi:hypothetical protein